MNTGSKPDHSRPGHLTHCPWLILLVATLATGCAIAPDSPPVADAAPSGPAAAAPAPAPPGTDPAWAAIAKVMERKGVLKDAIYTFTIPRDDLEVSIDGMGIPTGAGIESIFHFYRCPCGKMSVAGQFVACDYEANDIVDALRQNATLKVAAVAPFLLYEKPRLLMVRFQGEGDAVAMASVLREALRWTGRERMAPDAVKQPVLEEKGK